MIEDTRRGMEILPSERPAYFAGLRSVYGNEILSSEASLNAACQRRVEVLRHGFNSQWRNATDRLELAPRRLLVSVTQHCTFGCPHCWVFSSPAAKCSLSHEDLRAIHAHGTVDSVPRWTATGGEFFSHPDWDDILAQFPIDCVYSNGFWGYPDERCRKYVHRMAIALAKNPFLDRRTPTLILSYDRHHVEGNPRSFSLAKAVAAIVAHVCEQLPTVALRISHAQSESADRGYLDVVHSLEDAGIAVSPTALNECNGNIGNLSYSCTSQAGSTKELFVDTYPVAAVSRELITTGRWRSSWGLTETNHMSAPSRARYEYTVGPDGGVGLYSVLYAPPVPYWLGDLVREPWSVIAQRISRDPIALTLIDEGLEPIRAFMERFYGPLQELLARHFHSMQQFLYLCLLDPDRRLLLNCYLLRRLQDRRQLASNDKDLDQRLCHLFDAPDRTAEQVRQIYELATRPAESGVRSTNAN